MSLKASPLSGPTATFLPLSRLCMPSSYARQVTKRFFVVLRGTYGIQVNVIYLVPVLFFACHICWGISPLLHFEMIEPYKGTKNKLSGELVSREVITWTVKLVFSLKFVGCVTVVYMGAGYLILWKPKHLPGVCARYCLISSCLKGRRAMLMMINRPQMGNLQPTPNDTINSIGVPTMFSEREAG